jgi:nitrite reductase (NADH) small subunit
MMQLVAESAAKWIDIGAAADVPLRGARRIVISGIPIAVFRTGDGALFAIVDRCPHKGGPLSQGIVHGRAVACPLHNWTISLETGEAMNGDSGCVRTLKAMEQGGRVQVDASPLPGGG